MKRKKFFLYLPTWIFCAFIFTFMIRLIVLPKESFSEKEKRSLAEFPELNTETLLNGNFQNNLDTYLSDHFPAREFFVGLNADYNLLSGRNGENGIFLGSDGYLFPSPTQQTEDFLKNAGFIKEYADESDIPVYMTLIPSSGFINNDKLPVLHKEYHDQDMINEFKNVVADSVIFTDVTETFRQKSADQLYYKTDHHWTSKGAYECYRLLSETMGYSPVTESSFDKVTVKDFYGTSYSKGALWFVTPDEIELWSNREQPQDSVTVEIKDGSDAKQNNSYFFRDQLENMDKYPVFLDGNHSFVRVTNTNAPEGKLIVVKDSYGHCIVPFLSQNYREIVMVDLRYYKKPVSQLAEEEAADAVLILYSIDNMATDPNLSFLE